MKEKMEEGGRISPSIEIRVRDERATPNRPLLYSKGNILHKEWVNKKSYQIIYIKN